MRNQQHRIERLEQIVQAEAALPSRVIRLAPTGWSTSEQPAIDAGKVNDIVEKALGIHLGRGTHADLILISPSVREQTGRAVVAY